MTITNTEAVSDERLHDLIVAIEDAGLLLHDDMIDAAKAVRELLSRRAANSAGGVGPDFYAVWNGRTHIGTWQDAETASEVAADPDYSEARIVPLFTRSSPVSAEVTEEMVERAARAMCERDGFDWEPESCLQTANGDEPEEQRNYWRDKAEAALAALNGGRENG